MYSQTIKEITRIWLTCCIITSIFIMYVCVCVFGYMQLSCMIAMASSWFIIVLCSRISQIYINLRLNSCVGNVYVWFFLSPCGVYCDWCIHVYCFVPWFDKLIYFSMILHLVIHSIDFSINIHTYFCIWTTFAIRYIDMAISKKVVQCYLVATRRCWCT